MKLPAELRNMVHRQVLEPIFVGTHGNPACYLDQDFPLLNPQLTSRQVYQEVSEIVFRNGDFMIPAHFYRSIIPWMGKRFTDLLALKQLALYDFARDHPTTNMTIFITWYTFALASSSPHFFKEELGGICEILPEFKGLRSLKVEWRNFILEASEESRRVGTRTNFAYEFLMASIAASGDYH